jgi:hypothetical protein
MKPEGSLSCSQEPVAPLYPEPNEPSPRHMSSSSVLILRSYLRLRILRDLFPSDIETYVLYEYELRNYSIGATCRITDNFLIT